MGWTLSRGGYCARILQYVYVFWFCSIATNWCCEYGPAQWNAAQRCGCFKGWPILTENRTWCAKWTSWCSYWENWRTTQSSPGWSFISLSKWSCSFSSQWISHSRARHWKAGSAEGAKQEWSCELISLSCDCSDLNPMIDAASFSVSSVPVWIEDSTKQLLLGATNILLYSTKPSFCNLLASESKST